MKLANLEIGSLVDYLRQLDRYAEANHKSRSEAPLTLNKRGQEQSPASTLVAQSGGMAPAAEDAMPFRINTYGNLKRKGGVSAARFDQSLPQHVKQLFRHDFMWHLRITLTVETLRGSPVPASSTVAKLLGLRQGSAVKRLFLDHEVTFRWTSTQPSISSLRLLVDELQLVNGDLLFLGLSPDLNASAFCVRAVDIYRHVGLQRVAMMCGVTEIDGFGLLERIGGAVGLNQNSVSHGSLRVAFAERRDEEALSCLPAERRFVNEDPIDELAAMLE